MAKNNLVAPVLKWVGGKRQLFETFKPLFPKKFSTYCEPFLGGGAIFFGLQPKKAYINDINEDLMNVYSVIREDVESLIEVLSTFRNESNFFTPSGIWIATKKFFRACRTSNAPTLRAVNKFLNSAEIVLTARRY